MGVQGILKAANRFFSKNPVSVPGYDEVYKIPKEYRNKEKTI
jgi:hypothetical protein